MIKRNFRFFSNPEIKKIEIERQTILMDVLVYRMNFIFCFYYLFVFSLKLTKHENP